MGKSVKLVRLLFILLVMLNFAVGGWQLMVHFASDVPDPPQSRSFARVLSPGSLTLLREAEQLLFHGDAVLESATGLGFTAKKPMHSGMENQVAVQRLRQAAFVSGTADLAVQEPQKITLLPSADIEVVDESIVTAVQSLAAPENSVEHLAMSVGLDKPGSKACQALGPFDQSDEAGQLIDNMSRVSAIEAGVEQEQINVGSAYWVYVEPHASRKEARRTLAELKSQQIDSYIIVQQELLNGISVGMYTNKGFAEGRLQSVERLGYDVKIKVLDRTKKQYWVSFKRASVSEEHFSLVSKILQDRPGLKIKEDFCGLDLASKANIL